MQVSKFRFTVQTIHYEQCNNKNTNHNHLIILLSLRLNAAAK